MDLTRRSVLAGASVSSLVACTHTTPPRATPEDPDVALLADAVAREQALMATYAAAHVPPALVSDVTAHLARLAALHPSQPTPTATPAAALPRTARPKSLARATSEAHAAGVAVASKELAPVLASLAACAATHAAVL